MFFSTIRCLAFKVSLKGEERKVQLFDFSAVVLLQLSESNLISLLVYLRLWACWYCYQQLLVRKKRIEAYEPSRFRSHFFHLLFLYLQKDYKLKKEAIG